MFLLSFLRLFVLMFYPSLYPPSNDLDTSPSFRSNFTFQLDCEHTTYLLSRQWLPGLLLLLKRACYHCSFAAYIALRESLHRHVL